MSPVLATSIVLILDCSVCIYLSGVDRDRVTIRCRESGLVCIYPYHTGFPFQMVVFARGIAEGIDTFGAYMADESSEL